VPARHETRERSGQVIRRHLPHERAAAGSRLHDAEEFQRSEGLAYRGARDLELLGQLSLGRKLVARTKVALFEESLDLLDDALIEAAPADWLDNGQGLPPQNSGQVVRPD